MRQLAVVLSCGLLWACAAPPASVRRAPEPPQVWTAECGELRVQLQLERKPQHAQTYDVFITDLSGQVLTDITRVTLAATSAGKDISTATVVAQAKGSGHYEAVGGITTTPGSWQVEAIVRRADAPVATCVFYLNL